MAAKSILAALNPAIPRGRIASSSGFADYWALTKPDINFVILVTTAAAFCLGSAATPHFPWPLFLNALVGTGLVASGGAVLNQVMEVRFDSQMRRTWRRPLASDRVERI